MSSRSTSCDAPGRGGEDGAFAVVAVVIEVLRGEVALVLARGIDVDEVDFVSSVHRYFAAK